MVTEIRGVTGALIGYGVDGPSVVESSGGSSCGCLIAAGREVELVGSFPLGPVDNVGGLVT